MSDSFPPGRRRIGPRLLLIAGLLALLVPAATLVCSGDGGERRPYWLSRPAPAVTAARSAVPPLRAVTYNLHSGLGNGWRLSVPRSVIEANLRRIAADIAAVTEDDAPVDVVGLNEVDFSSRRSGWFDQAAFLAKELSARTGYRYRALGGETWRRDIPGLEVRFGNALLVRHPVAASGTRPLNGPETTDGPASGLLGRMFAERRSVLRARIDFHGHPVDLLVTHLEAFLEGEREAQAARLLADAVEPGVPTLLLGDLNAVPWSMTGARAFFSGDRTHGILAAGPLLDARVSLAARQGADDLSAWATYPAQEPRWPLDAVFATPELLPRTVRVFGDEASDHRGVAAEFAWLGPRESALMARWHRGLDGRGRPDATRLPLASGPEPALRRAALSAGSGTDWRL